MEQDLSLCSFANEISPPPELSEVALWVGGAQKILDSMGEDVLTITYARVVWA